MQLWPFNPETCGERPRSSPEATDLRGFLCSQSICVDKKRGYSLTVNNANDFMPQILTTATLADSVENVTRNRIKELFDIIT